MEPERSKPAGQAIWAYAYEIVPPQPEDRLRPLKAMLENEHSQAVSATRTWEGRLVAEKQITHILIVSDSPDQDREINRRLETELRLLETGFTLIIPLAVAGEVDHDPPSAAGNGSHPGR